MNMQKSAIFGGKRRVRISSQSLKRAMRTSDYYQQHFGVASIRTRDHQELKTKLLSELQGRYDEAVISQAIDWIIKDEKKEDAKKEASADAKEKEKKIPLAPWVIEEVAYFCEQIKQGEASDLDAKKLGKQIEKDSQGLRQAIGTAKDIALSGRMATSGLMSEVGKVDGAMAIAHVITTHTVDADIDWFTAVDDLQSQGSGHLDTQEFSSGVFYRYASLNIKQLQENLGDVSREEALNVAKHILHLLATIVPSAKQQSHAAHNVADLALVSFSDLPISLANAFETPIRAAQNGGFLQPSIKELLAYWQKANHKYSLEESVALFSLRDTETPENVKQLDTLENLKAWIANDTQEK
jgi:CRISPR system Cascade subunit CasC